MATHRPPLVIQVEIEGIKPTLPSTFTAKKWRIPGNLGPFNALPAIAESIRIPHRYLFMNAWGDNERREASLSLAQTWGLDDMERPLYARAIASDRTRFCLRFIFDVRHATRNRRPNNFKLQFDFPDKTTSSEYVHGRFVLAMGASIHSYIATRHDKFL
ncbi:hypothetical protein C8F01DRAFT_1245775 [Mycena amicta]|nr:hypothetical protein C8F01DRAFT_1245775 [Mycena amicta]